VPLTTEFKTISKDQQKQKMAQQRWWNLRHSIIVLLLLLLLLTLYNAEELKVCKQLVLAAKLKFNYLLLITYKANYLITYLNIKLII